MNDHISSKRTNGVGLALSGGGFRATLFHIGSLIRLNELGWMKGLAEVTSVSGGSIVAAYLGLRWKQLEFDDENVAINLDHLVTNPLRQFCAKTIDVGSVLGGVVNLFRHPSDLLANRYRKHLFGDATLQDLPADDSGPRFTIYATSLQTGASVRFARPYMAEYHLGKIEAPTILLARAVAASSAFPPVFCPVKLKLNPDQWERLEGANLYDNKDFRSKMLLADGGVYDNLGLQRISGRYTTVLVSDAGAPMSIMENPFWIRMSQIARTVRVLGIMGEQCRAVRKRWLVSDYLVQKMGGTYWGIDTNIRDYQLEENGRPGPIIEDSEITESMSDIRTRLNRFKADEQERLINWGYALADAGMRRWVLDPSTPAGTLPYPDQPMK